MNQIYTERKHKILSNTRDKIKHTDDCPSEIQSLIRNINGKVFLNEVRSKKLFEYLRNLKKQNDILLPNLKSGNKFKISNFTNSGQSHNQSLFNVKQDSSFNSDEYDQKELKIQPRILNKDEIQRNYRAINDKIRTKLEQEKNKRRIIFTFNPKKIRIKSPNPARFRSLIE